MHNNYHLPLYFNNFGRCMIVRAIPPQIMHNNPNTRELDRCNMIRPFSSKNQLTTHELSIASRCINRFILVNPYMLLFYFVMVTI